MLILRLVAGKLLTAIILAFALSCSLSEDFNYSSTEDLIVVNGVLNPDSTIFIGISHLGMFPGVAVPDVIESAAVSVFENDSLLGELTYNSEAGGYSLNYYPKAGNIYHIRVQVNDYPVISAKTSIPPDIAAAVCYGAFPQGDIRTNNDIFADITVQNDSAAYALWLSFTSRVYRRYDADTFPYTRYDSSTIQNKLVSALNSNSALIDKFNGMNDRGFNLYKSYIRIDAAKVVDSVRLQVFSEETDVFFKHKTIKELSPDLGLYAHIYSVSDEFDRYWKASLLNYLNSNLETDVPNPFAEPVTSYSNITNGAGIFAGYNSKTFGIHNAPCN